MYIILFIITVIRLLFLINEGKYYRVSFWSFSCKSLKIVMGIIYVRYRRTVKKITCCAFFCNAATDQSVCNKSPIVYSRLPPKHVIFICIGIFTNTCTFEQFFHSEMEVVKRDSRPYTCIRRAKQTDLRKRDEGKPVNSEFHPTLTKKATCTQSQHRYEELTLLKAAEEVEVRCTPWTKLEAKFSAYADTVVNRSEIYGYNVFIFFYLYYFISKN